MKDDVKYVVRFKNLDIKKTFKQFYSLYGPLFVVCHIGVSLISLGSFSALVWLTVDPVQYVPDFIIMNIGQSSRSWAAEGSKFVIAYGLHKFMLPFRIAASIYLTKYLAPRIKFFKR